jgi:N-hydroxyarylamine O-acetyltransferase
MTLSENEINIFFEVVHLNKSLKRVSLDFLNELIISVAEYIPWQNVTMIENNIGYIPTFDDIKTNMLLGKGGICLDINRFMFYLLKEIGFEVQYILCGRRNAEKRHIAIIVYFDKEPYFVDFGDAQLYYRALKLNDTRRLRRSTIEYQIQNIDEEYHLMIRKNGGWKVHYLFNLQKCSEVDFSVFIKKYYSNIYFGPFWKAVHFAYYPNQKLRAIKGASILYEKENGEIIKLKYSNIEDFKANLAQYFSPLILKKHDFPSVIKRLKDINLKERFGIHLNQSEVNTFLQKIGIKAVKFDLIFLKEIIAAILERIPFQNYKMIERGFGHIPTENDIKEDMLSLNGGTCATMNAFVGALLYQLGFNTALINGTMSKENDHISILLKINNKDFVIDLGDGQPYFEPLLCNKEVIVKHPFRTYRTVVEGNDLRIDFLIKEKWYPDVRLHLIPKAFKKIHKTLEQHYTQKEFGPFWKGIRFAIYINKEIIAIRDKTFILQNSNSIEKIIIRDKSHLNELLEEYLLNFKPQINLCFTKINLL